MVRPQELVPVLVDVGLALGVAGPYFQSLSASLKLAVGTAPLRTNSMGSALNEFSS